MYTHPTGRHGREQTSRKTTEMTSNNGHKYPGIAPGLEKSMIFNLKNRKSDFLYINQIF